jgi:hypothetical protein
MFAAFNTPAGKSSVHGQSRRKKRPTETNSKSRKLCDDKEAAVPAWLQSVGVEDKDPRDRLGRVSSRSTAADKKVLSAQVGVAVVDTAIQSVSSAERKKEVDGLSASLVDITHVLDNVERRLKEMAVACVRSTNEQEARLKAVVGQLSRDVERVGRVVSAQQGCIEQWKQEAGALATTLRQIVAEKKTTTCGVEVGAVGGPVVSTTVATGEDTPRKADVLVGEGNGLVRYFWESIRGPLILYWRWSLTRE